MPKKTNYFSHDSNARNDCKILALRMKYGIEGYGIYFMVLERLREESEYMCIKDYNSIAFDLRADSSKIKSIIEDFGLFVFTEDGKYFYSESFIGRMALKDEKSNKASENAKKRWGNTKNDADAMRTHTKNNADALPSHEKTDASKVKESKVNKEYKEKIFPTMPKAEDVGELPKSILKKYIERIGFAQNIIISEETALSLWDIFKTENLTGKNYQPNIEAIYTFFLRTARYEKINNANVIPINRKTEFVQ